MLFRRVNSLAPEDAAAAKAGLDAANVSGGGVEWARAGLPLTRAAGGAA